MLSVECKFKWKKSNGVNNRFSSFGVCLKTQDFWKSFFQALVISFAWVTPKLLHGSKFVREARFLKTLFFKNNHFAWVSHSRTFVKNQSQKFWFKLSREVATKLYYAQNIKLKNNQLSPAVLQPRIFEIMLHIQEKWLKSVEKDCLR